MLEVGRVARSHGLRGDILVSFTTDRIAERSAPGAVLVIADREYVVEKARPHQRYQLMVLAGLRNREQADRLRGQLIFAEPFEDEGAIFVHEVIGAQLVDQHGTNHGKIVSVLANPASDLMELADGRLVPFSFFVSQVGATVRVSVPLGLLDDEALSERDTPASDRPESDGPESDGPESSRD